MKAFVNKIVVLRLLHYDMRSKILIREATINDSDEIANLAKEIWKNNSISELKKEFTESMASVKACIYVFEDKDKRIKGFAQCNLRYDYVEGTKSSPVGFLEGIFITEEYRGKGIGKVLLSAAQSWAKENGCIEFACDCGINNSTSYNFHIHNGFKEVNRIICFSKKI